MANLNNKKIIKSWWAQIFFQIICDNCYSSSSATTKGKNGWINFFDLIPLLQWLLMCDSLLTDVTSEEDDKTVSEVGSDWCTFLSIYVAVALLLVIQWAHYYFLLVSIRCHLFIRKKSKKEKENELKRSTIIRIVIIVLKCVIMVYIHMCTYFCGSIHNNKLVRIKATFFLLANLHAQARRIA